MLNFNGIGNAFNGDLGNNSAFIKSGTSLLLIDCGGTVFSTIDKNGVLEDVEKIYIVITHTHLDHVGSLGDLLFYCYYILKIKETPKILFPNTEDMKKFLSIVGIRENMYVLNGEISQKIEDENIGDIKIDFKETSHVNNMRAYGFILNVNERKIYYSGDSNKLDNEIIEMLKKGEIEAIYQDTFGPDIEGTAHLSLRKLKEIVPKELRKSVYCMHLDKSIDLHDILKDGFNIANKL